MSQDKHTPGPWVAVVPPRRTFHNGTDITSYLVFSSLSRGELNERWPGRYDDDPSHFDNVVICDTFLMDLSLQEGCANARLIAAAPDMLELLHLIAKDTDQTWRDLDGGDVSIGEIMEQVNAIHQRTREAIAKARGDA